MYRDIFTEGVMLFQMSNYKIAVHTLTEKVIRSVIEPTVDILQDINKCYYLSN